MANTNQSEFVNPGVCSMPGCEVTLVLDDGTNLYVCKHSITNKCEFFKLLFTADFREKDSNTVKIRKVFRLDMLQFLSCALGQASLPLERGPLSALLSLADQFMCPWLQQRINTHLDTNQMFLNASPDTKLGLVLATAKYMGACPFLLQTAIRLCANLTPSDVSVLRGRISKDAFDALIAMIRTADKEIGKLMQRPGHRCPKDRGCGAFVISRYDQIGTLVDVGRVKEVEVWKCSKCEGFKIKDILTYDKVKQFRGVLRKRMNKLQPL